MCSIILREWKEFLLGFQNINNGFRFHVCLACCKNQGNFAKRMKRQEANVRRKIKMLRLSTYFLPSLFSCRRTQQRPNHLKLIRIVTAIKASCVGDADRDLGCSACRQREVAFSKSPTFFSLLSLKATSAHHDVAPHRRVVLKFCQFVMACPHFSTCPMWIFNNNNNNSNNLSRQLIQTIQDATSQSQTCGQSNPTFSASTAGDLPEGRRHWPQDQPQQPLWSYLAQNNSEKPHAGNQAREGG